MGPMASQQFLKRKGFLSVATAAATGLTMFSVRISRCEQSRTPSRFGRSIVLTGAGQQRQQSSSSSLSHVDTSNKDDCPVCKKFSQGPCGEIFKTWMACTDEYPGKNPDHPNEAWHLSKCQHLAMPLGACLEKHESYYDELDIYADDDDEDQLMDAWNKVISDVEATCSTVPFPSAPELQIKLSNNTGMASFEYGFSGQKIVMTYVRDDNSGELLAAGSRDDLWSYKGKGILRLAIPPSCTSVTAYALYVDEHDNDILYQHSQRVPRI
jgi:hypothetical protein